MIWVHHMCYTKIASLPKNMSCVSLSHIPSSVTNSLLWFVYRCTPKPHAVRVQLLEFVIIVGMDATPALGQVICTTKKEEKLAS